MNRTGPFTASDALLLSSIASGAWWATGGPTWAALVSIAADLAAEAGNPKPTSPGIAWESDGVLTPLALFRMAKVLHQPQLPFAAPLVLVLHEKMRALGVVPDAGGARALVMVATILMERYPQMRLGGAEVPRLNPSTSRRARRTRR